MSVILRSIHVINLFGRSYELRLENLGDGLNAVYAENGVGKSTVATAVSALLHPRDLHRATRVHAEFESDGQSVSVILNGNSVEPTVFRSARPDLCRLGISDILRAQDPDSQVLVTALSGGVDLATVIPVTRPQAPVLASLEQRFADRERQARTVSDSEASLGSLRERSRALDRDAKDFEAAKSWLAAMALDDQGMQSESTASALEVEWPGIGRQAADALERSGALETQWRNVAQRLRDSRNELAALCPVPAQGSLRETDRLESARLRVTLGGFETSLQSGERTLALRRDALATAGQQVVAAGGDVEQVPHGGVSGDSIATAEQHDRLVEEARQQVASAKVLLEQTLETEATVARGIRLTGLLPEDVLENLLTAPGIPAVADEARKARVERQERERIADALAAEAGALAKPAESTLRTLVEWLAAVPEQSTSGAGGNGLLRWGLLAIALIGGLVAGILASPWIGFVLAALVSVALGFIRSGAKIANDPRPAIQSRLAAEQHPATWEANSVTARIEELLRAKATVEIKSEWSTQLRRQAQAVDVSSEQTLAERWRQFKDATGLDAPQDPYRFGDLLRRIARWDDAVHARMAAEGRCASAQQAYERVLEDRSRWLGSRPGGTWSTGAGFIGWVSACQAYANAFQELQRAQSDHDAVIREKQSAEKRAAELVSGYGFPVSGAWVDVLDLFPRWFTVSATLANAEAEHWEIEKALVSFLDDSGVPGDSELGERLALLGRREQDAVRYRTAVDVAAEYRSQARALRHASDNTMPQRHGLDSGSDRLAWEAVRDRLARANDERGEVQLEIGRILESIRHLQAAENWSELERDASTQLRSASGWVDRKRQSLANQLVRSAIEDAVEGENIPQVVERARNWVQRFTGGRYDRIGVEREDLGNGQLRRHLVVRDTLDNSLEKRLDQLSTGTRAHLAFAVRLAVLEDYENDGPRLPLLVDEMLATSGHEARENIASALHDIARERQVVYFTNSAADLRLLGDRAGETVNGERPPVREFVLNGSPEPVLAVADAQPPVSVVPEPDGLPLWQPVSQWTPAWRDRFFGPGWDKDAVEAEHLTRAADAVRSQLAQVIRRLEWSDLMGGNLVTPAMEARIREHYDTTGGDPRQFLKTVGAVQGIGATARQRYADWLTSNGYLEPIPPDTELVRIAADALAAMDGQTTVLASGVVALYKPFLTSESTA
jgi:hypothetical protein